MAGILIVIPARYHSSRLPGKPLRLIAGVPMVERVARVAAAVRGESGDRAYVVATDHEEIREFCASRGLPVVMTPATCRDGTERCRFAAEAAREKPRLVVNLQGDNPLCPPWVLSALIRAWEEEPDAAVYTPCVRLDWEAYDALVEAKRTTPFSGTTVLVDKNFHALAFSKAILPVVRRQEEARRLSPFSPVLRHVGLYAYTFEALTRHATLEVSPYERGEVEGLEQMRFLYNALPVKVVEVDYRGRETSGGVDSEEDIARVEAILAKYGELDAG
ncbi:MAG: 3-deoxy-manno-octulosonate cytidylyltransferase [Odoribacteraceae bacterium]|jgi:3-deoxy-manno-octulosonate cytidylyltransferase (CMP-KDO synthetase)|nr:3-deoxy-manno-octulosonate cytidylyltransferase [Odoribacteraceae bacterium]